jgi:hypothetical protein
MNVRILGVFTAPNGLKMVDYMAREVVRLTNGPYPPLVNQPFREKGQLRKKLQKQKMKIN